jgi:hypothetical protein
MMKILTFPDKLLEPGSIFFPACVTYSEKNSHRSLTLRRDGRVAEGARLESVFTRKGNVGSNPTLSASLINAIQAFPLRGWSVAHAKRGYSSSACSFAARRPISCPRCLARLVTQVVAAHQLLWRARIIQTAKRRRIFRNDRSACSGIIHAV